MARWSITPLMYHGNMLPLMFRKLLMQATQLPYKMMEGMTLGFVYCAVRSTPPQFVVHVVEIIVRSVHI